MTRQLIDSHSVGAVMKQQTMLSVELRKRRIEEPLSILLGNLVRVFIYHSESAAIASYPWPEGEHSKEGPKTEGDSRTSTDHSTLDAFSSDWRDGSCGEGQP